MATLNDISRETGLSIATVSHALNNRPGYSQATRRRVREAAKALGYSANPLARGLLGKSTKTVGLLWTLAGPHLSEGMARDIALRMQKRGYVTHLTDSLSDPEIVQRQLADYRQRGVDAVVIQQGSNNGMLSEEVCRQLSQFKAAVAVSVEAPALEMDWVHHDLPAGYAQAADHLADTGRRRPAIFLRAARSEAKIEAFLGRCRERGMEVSDASVIDFRNIAQLRELTAGCRQALEERFPGDFPFDCLMCSADEVAGAALGWLRSRGLRAPEDVAVVGCNDALLSESMTPPLASIDRQDGQVADAIEALIFSRLKDSQLPPRRRDVQARFVWRESAGGRGERGEVEPLRGQETSFMGGV